MEARVPQRVASANAKLILQRLGWSAVAAPPVGSFRPRSNADLYGTFKHPSLLNPLNRRLSPLARRSWTASRNAGCGRIPAAVQFLPLLYDRYVALERRIGHTLSPTGMPLPNLTGFSAPQLETAGEPPLP